MPIEPVHILAITADSLFRIEEVPDQKPPANAVIVQGITTTFGFHPERLESHRAEVRELLAQLPPEFMKDQGGGWSFLKMCLDKDGQQWGEHRDMEALTVLGIGLGMASFVLPRALWVVFPGGMPYIVIDVDGKKKEDKAA